MKDYNFNLIQKYHKSSTLLIDDDHPTSLKTFYCLMSRFFIIQFIILHIWIWMGTWQLVETQLMEGLRILSLLHNSEKLDNVETHGANNYDKCSEEDCELCGSI